MHDVEHTGRNSGLQRELADRTETDLPPAVRLAVAQGEWAALTELAEAGAKVPGAVALGPALVVPAEDDEKPQNASLLKGMRPEDVDLATALRLLTRALRFELPLPNVTLVVVNSLPPVSRYSAPSRPRTSTCRTSPTVK